MRKIWVVAAREYKVSVRTKTFLLGLLIMPIMMGASVILQWLLRDVVDTKDKHFVLIDRTNRQELVAELQKKIKERNETVVDAKTDKQTKPRFLIEEMPASEAERSAISKQRYQLSERIRKGELIGFLELLLPDADAAKKSLGTQVVLHYQTNRQTYNDFASLADNTVTEFSRKALAEEAKLTETQTKALLRPTRLDTKGLSSMDEKTGEVRDPSDEGRFASIIAPMVLMMLMFMVVLMGSTPLMQGVVEEKMQRIAEVLLGSVRPFELMLGKLLGMTGVSLTISGVYLVGAYWAAHQFGVAQYVSIGLMLWFVVFQALAALMFGSLFIAIGAACTEMKETQNLLLPVMLLASLPMFLLGSVIREPNGPVVQAISFFPFATPSLMIARLSSPPGLPLWEPLLGVVIVLATTLLCVYAAGRIFRVGILMQGKGAKISEMLRWIFKG